MARHGNEIATNPEYESIRPALEASRKLISKLPDMSGPRRDEFQHALLCFVTSNGIEAACKKMAGERYSVNAQSMRPLIVKALLDTSHLWEEHQDFLQKKGALFVAKKFRIPAQVLGLEPGGNFDQARRRVAIEFLPILDKALEFAMIPKEVSKPIHMDKHLLTYTATQLMSPGREKQARFNAVSLKLTEKEHQRFVQNSYKAITDIAQRLDIILPQGLLQEGKAPAPAPVPLQSAQPFFTAKGPAKLTPAEIEAKARAESAGELRTRLMGLKSNSQITGHQGLVYLFVNSGSDISSQREREVAAAAKFKCAPQEIREICDQVGGLLNPSESSRKARPRARLQ